MNILQGFFKQAENIAKHERLEKRMKSARILSKNKCIRCGFCCYQRSCIPTPAELKKIAKFLNLSAKELIDKYYAIDRRTIENIYYVKPVGINIKDLAGKFIPADRTFGEGKCIFLEKKGKKFSCKIYPVRPKQAKIMTCWKELEEYEPIESWKENKLLKIFGIDGKKEEEIQDDRKYDEENEEFRN